MVNEQRTSDGVTWRTNDKTKRLILLCTTSSAEMAIGNKAQHDQPYGASAEMALLVAGTLISRKSKFYARIMQQPVKCRSLSSELDKKVGTREKLHLRIRVSC